MTLAVGVSPAPAIAGMSKIMTAAVEMVIRIIWISSCPGRRHWKCDLAVRIRAGAVDVELGSIDELTLPALGPHTLLDRSQDGSPHEFGQHVASLFGRV
jgi:hypothetical protein